MTKVRPVERRMRTGLMRALRVPTVRRPPVGPARAPDGSKPRVVSPGVGDLGDPAEPARLRRQRVGDRAEHDDREDADHPIEQGDRGRLRQRDAVGRRSGRRRRPASTIPRPAGLSGTAVSSEPIRATNTAPDRPSDTSAKPSAWTTRNRRSASVIQIEPGQARRGCGSWRAASAPKTPSSNRSYSSRICVRQRQGHDDPPAEVAHREQPDRQHDDDDDADPEDDLDRRRQAVAEAPVAGGEPEHGDREQVEDALDEDRPEGPATARRSLLIFSR